MCAVREYLKHMGRMDPSYPVHVQWRHARDRLIHLIYKIFRCCGGRFRRGGVKSANQTHELPRDRGRTPFPRGKEYLDPRSPPSIQELANSAPGLGRDLGPGGVPDARLPSRRARTLPTGPARGDGRARGSPGPPPLRAARSAEARGHPGARRQAGGGSPPVRAGMAAERSVAAPGGYERRRPARRSRTSRPPRVRAAQARPSRIGRRWDLRPRMAGAMTTGPSAKRRPALFIRRTSSVCAPMPWERIGRSRSDAVRNRRTPACRSESGTPRTHCASRVSAGIPSLATYQGRVLEMRRPSRKSAPERSSSSMSRGRTGLERPFAVAVGDGAPGASPPKRARRAKRGRSRVRERRRPSPPPLGRSRPSRRSRRCRRPGAGRRARRGARPRGPCGAFPLRCGRAPRW